MNNEKALRGDANTARWLYSKADPQTNKHTDRGDYNTLCSLARSVKSTRGYNFTHLPIPSTLQVCLFSNIAVAACLRIWKYKYSCVDCDSGVSARGVQRGELDILAEVRAVPEVDGRVAPEAVGSADLRRSRGRVRRRSGQHRLRSPSVGRAASRDGARQPVRRRAAAGLPADEIRPVPALPEVAQERRRGRSAAAGLRRTRLRVGGLRRRRWRREGATTVVAAAELAGGQATPDQYPRRGGRHWRHGGHRSAATGGCRRRTREQ